VTEEQSKQHASNFQNVSNVSLISKNDKWVNLLTPDLKGKILFFRVLQSDIMLFFVRYHFGTDRNIQNVGYTAKLGYITRTRMKKLFSEIERAIADTQRDRRVILHFRSEGHDLISLLASEKRTV
jgi:hypothetical protein